MKFLKILYLTIAIITGSQPIYAQTYNWNSMEDSKHIITAGFGWDYSMSFGLGYAYQTNTKIPGLLTFSMLVPSGAKPLDDFKTKLGGQFVVFDRQNFKGIITAQAIYRRYENPLVRLQNIGSEFKGAWGYYKSKWFIAGEIGFDKAIVTHFDHSDSFKENVFRDVEDGWYQPSTGGNLNYGLQTGYSFLKSGVTLNFGKITTQDFKSSPLIPFYFMLGYNYRIQ